MRTFTKILFTTLALAAIAGCASNNRTPAQQMRGTEGYGVALRAEPIEYYKAACNRREFDCEIFEASMNDKQILEVAVAAKNGKLVTYKVVSLIEDRVKAGEVIKFRFGNDKYFAGHAVQVPVKDASCGWKNGSISALKGGVECLGWSYLNYPLFQ